MGVGFNDGGPVGDPDGVPCDPERWSEDSKRSVAYEFRPRRYRDKVYFCWRCDAKDVFTAKDQQHAYEVRKVNINQARCLCQACYKVWIGLEQEALHCRERWGNERKTLRNDLEFLRGWLAVLEAIPGYKGKADYANISRLRRLIADLDGKPPVH
jgi:hypothetical protein